MVIKKLRAKKNRARALGIKYSGDNVSEINQFTGYNFLEEKNHEYLKCQSSGIKIEKNDWVIVDTMSFLLINVMKEEKMQKLYDIKGDYYYGQGNRKNNKNSKKKKI